MAEKFLTVYVNGKAKQLPESTDPKTTLLSYLRNTGLTGTKLGCGEGGCGACTVMLSYYDHSSDKIRHISANACLTPLCGLDGYAVTTVEGIGNMRRGLHPVQKRIANLFGSQCGFCTPGIVMALYAFLRECPEATPHEIEEALDGNLCRCTGYRPILDAAKSLSSFKCCGGGGKGGGCPCKEGSGAASSDSSCCKDKSPSSSSGNIVTRNTDDCMKEQPSLAEEMTSLGWTEPIFPPALVRYRPKSLVIGGAALVDSTAKTQWIQPVDLMGLHEAKAKYPAARLIVGNTEVGIETRFKYLEYDVLVNPSHVAELNTLRVEGDGSGIRVGACVRINALRQFVQQLEGKDSNVGAHQLRGLVAIKDMLSWFASNQIRNVACVGGNIATASPISDLNPMLMACGAMLRVSSTAETRDIAIATDFFLSYRKTALKPDEILESIFIPFTKQWEFVVPSKQARRREDDISIVTAGIRVNLAPTGDNWVINEIALSYGGMAPTTVMAKNTANALAGQVWAAQSIETVYDTLHKEMLLPETVPGGQAEYRMALTASFLFRSFIRISLQIQECLEQRESSASALPLPPHIDAKERSAAESFLTSPKDSSTGEQQYHQRKANDGIQQSYPVPHKEVEGVDSCAPVGESIVHKSAHLQVSGEAVYTDDIQSPANATHAALVTSSRGHARIVRVDATPAETCDGFVAFYCAKDITGSNNMGAILHDEEVFASEIAKHFNAVIGIVVCESHEQAMYAARKVVVEYEDLPVVCSIEEAIAAESFYPVKHVIENGDMEKEVANADVVVEGSVNIGSQEHFYLEPMCTLVIPKENGLDIFSSTQNVSHTQETCAEVVGLASANVVCRVKRMGGGFGGKESRSMFIAAAASQAAHLLGRPVHINIERDLDMATTGQRHAFVVKYRAGCKANGMLSFMDIDMYSNGGFSWDLSQPVMDRALFHCDNVYHWPALTCRGTVCRTNQPSHTAFRGFGGPQGLMVTETMVHHLHEKLKGMSCLAFKEKNLYKRTDFTHFGQSLDHFNVPELLQNLKSNTDLAERENAIAEFNAQHKWKKRGMCTTMTKFGINFTATFMNQGGALVHVYKDGTVLVSHGGTEMGQGLHTKVIQVAAQVFGIPHSKITVEDTSTSCVANGSPTAASASTDLYGMAVLNACEKIRDRLIPVREKLQADNQPHEWNQVVTAGYFSRVDLSAHGFYKTPDIRCSGFNFDMELPKSDARDKNSQRGTPFNYFTEGVVCTEVEIDCLSGDHKVLRVDIVMDLGKSINPLLDIGQIEGAFMQGYGYSTMEEMVWGDSQHKWVRPGQLFTRGPGTYKIPAFNDVPLDFRVHLSDTHNPFAVHSSKAVGEPPFFLGCCALFAIQDAIKAARLDDAHYPLHLPATSERIRMACHDSLTARIVGSEEKAQNYQSKYSC